MFKCKADSVNGSLVKHGQGIVVSLHLNRACCKCAKARAKPTLKCAKAACTEETKRLSSHRPEVDGNP